MNPGLTLGIAIVLWWALYHVAVFLFVKLPAWVKPHLAWLHSPHRPRG